MTHVGLGTARNFSSGRPLFQQLADNVPIADRAFYEADWDLDPPKERLHRKHRPSKKTAAVAAHLKRIDPPSENGWFERRLDSSNANSWLDDLSDSDSDALLWFGFGLGRRLDGLGAWLQL
ncbi:hypothetical protein B0H16DRAFT_1727223 [Mycena metata]|uniref:Uncharacterized protein n=1 Tax=Mycena metata TaxID=1033252 RepID=A0AAD7N407_9AGAR|nr:hypothetical protein B0H16DRAFT_1727223 [Mycena metata]